MFALKLLLDGKKALVTGGSRGIGRAICVELNKLGAEVYALGKTKENLDELKNSYPRINTIQVDVTDWDSTKDVVNNIGYVDILVNNVGSGKMQALMDTNEADFDYLVNVNLKSAFNISQVVAQKMITRGVGGTIVNMSSVYGSKPSKYVPLYSITKAGLEMLTKVMALELGPHNIRVNSVAPTVVYTDLTKNFIENKDLSGPLMDCHPMGKFAELEDVVNAVLFLISEKAAMIIGTVMPVDGGFLVN